MSTANLPDDGPNDELHSSQSGEDSTTSATVLENEGRASLDDSTLRCEKCGAEIKTNDTLACRACGWYASIGSYVEIDQSWEAQCDPNAEDAAAEEEEQFTLPQWAVVLSVVVVAVIGINVFLHLTMPSVSAARTSWSLMQLSLGGFVFAVCHFVCFSKLMSVKADTNLLDILLSPHKCWSEMFDHLPSGQWMAHGAAGGLTAAALSILLIGGIPYERLWDWGFEKPPEQNLMAAVMSQAQQIEGDEDGLEEAVEGFAGTQNLDDLEDEGLEETPAVDPRQTIDGVILGYRTNEEGLAATLLIGVEHKGALVYAGRVFPELPDNELAKLTQKLGAWKSKVPYVNTDEAGVIWVQPKQVCKVSYQRQGPSGWLYEAKFEKLRSVMDLTGK